MLPVIYSASSTEFSSNGQGVLIDCLSCKVTEERNGIFEMELTYPVSGQHADKLVVDAIIKATAHKGDDGQLFRIYEIDKDLDGNIEIHCQHISYQLSFIPCAPFVADNIGAAMTAIRNNMQTQNDGFSFTTDKSTVATMKIDVPTSTRSVLGGMEGSVLDTYHGEYEFNNFVVKLWNSRGRDNNVVLRYGKNITDISQESNIAETYTGLRPYYYDEDELVELATSDKCVWCDNAGSFPYKRVLILDCTSDFNDLTDEYGDKRAPTPAELLSYANSYLANHDFGVPKVTVKVEFEALWDTPEYAEVANLETVNLCDTVHVKFEELDISVDAKVVKTQYDSLLDRYSSLTIGSITANFTDSVAQISERTVEAVAETATRLELAQQRATNILLGTNGGYKVEKRNGDGYIIETLYMDSLTEGTANKIWRWNVNGLGYSPNGPAGPYTVAITKNGEIVADFITTGTLDANDVNVVNLKANNVYVDASTTLSTTLTNQQTQITANANGLTSKVSITDYTGAEIASRINQSADSVVIQANHIKLEGLTTVNQYFKINTDGSMEATSGKIGRFNITSTSLNTGTGTSTAGMGGNQAFWAGNSSSNSAPFRVSYAGELVATNATISGSITATSLTLVSGAKIPASTGVSGLASVATSGSYNDLSSRPDLTLYVQKDGTIGSAPAAGATGFVVSSAGLLQASNAVIYGTLYASAGKIANFTISGNLFQCITTNTTGTQYRTYVNGTSAIGSVSSSGSFGVQSRTSSTADWTNEFYVLANGQLYAKNADITGKITATSGSFTGTITSTNAVITGGSIDIETSSETSDKILLRSAKASTSLAPNGLYVLNSSSATVPNRRAIVNGGAYYIKNTVNDTNVVYMGVISTNHNAGMLTLYSGASYRVHNDADGIIFYDSSSNLTSAIYNDQSTNMVRLYTSTSSSYTTSGAITGLGQRYRAFILMATRGSGLGAMASTVIPLNMAKTSNANSESWAVSAQNTSYQAKCYFDFTNNKIYLSRNNTNSDCRAEVWGLR